MTNHPSASDPGVPYVPAWSDATPPQGQPAVRAPHDPAPAPRQPDGRGRGEQRSVLLSPLVLGLSALLLAIVGVGAYLYFNGGEKRTLSEGMCLNDLSGNTPNITDCGASDAKYKIVEIFTDTIDGGQCASVTGADIPLLIDRDGTKQLLCVMKIA